MDPCVQQAYYEYCDSKSSVNLVAGHDSSLYPLLHTTPFDNILPLDGYNASYTSTTLSQLGAKITNSHLRPYLSYTYNA